VTRNVPASVKARLLNEANRQGEELERFLVRYSNERFLYRLGASGWRDRFILKGASLITLWQHVPYRMTRDVDLLAYGSSDAVTVRAAIEEICSVPCEQDGLVFEMKGLEISPIRAEDEYPGQRATFVAQLGNARIRLQVDLGFGDAVTPAPENVEYPTILGDLPAPQVKAYPRVVAVAEKLEAMVHLGTRNSRMKDFHDIWSWSSSFPFDGSSLRAAVVACFGRRRTAATERPEALTPAFYEAEALRARWKAYGRSGGFRPPPPDRFAEIGVRVIDFLGPLHDSVVSEEQFPAHWPSGGPWSREGGSIGTAGVLGRR
jgi:hypothetical protein